MMEEKDYCFRKETQIYVNKKIDCYRAPGDLLETYEIGDNPDASYGPDAVRNDRQPDPDQYGVIRVVVGYYYGNQYNGNNGSSYIKEEVFGDGRWIISQIR